MNNVMRQEYRPLTKEDSESMLAVKAKGTELHELISSLGKSRELSLALTKTEEAVMWTTKHLTGP